MAVTTASDLFVPEVANRYMRQAFVQKLALFEKFMGPGAELPIQIVNDPVFAIEGEYLKTPAFKRISSLVTRRDLTSVASVTPLELTGTTEQGVKLSRKIGPVDISRDAALFSRATGDEIMAEIGRQAGEQLAVNLQTSTLATLRGITAGMTTTAHTLSVWDAAARTNMSASLLSRGKALLGDNRGDIKYGIMHSDVWHDLFLEAQGKGYDMVGGRALGGAEGTNHLGLDLGNVDDTYLTTADAGYDKYHTLLMGSGVIKVQFIRPLMVYPIFQTIDTEQVIDRWRADADYAINNAAGMTWDSGNIGANPTDANLAAAGSWDAVYTSHKEVKLVELVSNSSLN